MPGTIDWSTPRAALLSLTLSVPLGALRDRLAAQLQSEGTAYDNSFDGDTAAVAAFNQAIADYDKTARYAENILRQKVAGPWSPTQHVPADQVKASEATLAQLTSGVLTVTARAFGSYGNLISVQTVATGGTTYAIKATRGEYSETIAGLDSSVASGPVSGELVTAQTSGPGVVSLASTPLAGGSSALASLYARVERAMSGSNQALLPTSLLFQVQAAAALSSAPPTAAATASGVILQATVDLANQFLAFAAFS